MSDFATELRAWLLTQDEDLPLYVGKLPSSPELAAAIYDVGGQPDRWSPARVVRVRTIVRGETRAAARELADSIYDLLRSMPAGGAQSVDLTSWHVYGVAPMEPQQISSDPNNRPEFSFDAEANVRPIS